MKTSYNLKRYIFIIIFCLILLSHHTVRNILFDFTPSIFMRRSLPLEYMSNSESSNLPDSIIIQKPACPGNERSKLITFISTRKNFENRKLFRIYHKAMGNIIPVMFLIGQKSENEDFITTNRIQMEIEKYSDFIIGNYTDLYNNLNLKEIALIRLD